MEYKRVGRTALPCLFNEHEFDGWELRTNAMGVRKNGHNDYTFSCRKCNESKRFSETARIHRALKNTTKQTAEKSDTNDTQVAQKRVALQKTLTDIFQQMVSTRRANDTAPIAFLINGFTGLGKSHITKDVFAANMDKLIEAGTTTLSISLNSEIRDQDYFDMLRRSSPDRVINWKGRKHGFDKIAQIPLNRREQDETLFNTGAMCPIADKVDAAQKRGIAAWEMCRRCAFFDICKEKG